MISFAALNKNLKKDASLFPNIRVALMGDTATQFLNVAIRGMGIENQMNLSVFEAEYNQVERQVLDPSSELHQYDAKVVVVFQSTHKLLSKYNSLSPEKRLALASERLQFVQTICDTIHGNIIYYNYPEIDDAVFGSFDNKIESSFLWQLRELNVGLMKLAETNKNLYICDLSSIQNRLGRREMFDASVYVSTEMVLSLSALPYVAQRTVDIIKSIEGKIKKCLILDLDNTLWGGVIGDDGMENIQLGHGLGIGKAFTEFQQWIKKLKERGIILAVCSKNTESIAKEPFEKHPDMVLRLDDIAVFVANWENKVDNIRQIQQILNIGYDSMVFIDDNPAEREIVRTNIPTITVPELPEDPADYLEFMYEQNLFETVSYSALDKNRTKQYQEEALRVTERKSYTDESDFLKSLEMVSAVSGFTKFNIPRVAQLSQRSNQFNLRTVRFTENEVMQMANDEHYVCFTFTLKDKFGDNGLICVIILEKQSSETLFINTWLMSCRVLKRGMESFSLNKIVICAKQLGFKKIIGEYIETSKNKMVKNHYLALGFEPLANDSKHLFQLDVDSYVEKNCYIKEKING